MPNDDPLASALGDARRATRDQVTAVWQTQMERLRDVLSRDWREQMCRVIDDRFTEFESALKPRILEARRDVIRSFGRHWNECFHRMREAGTDREWCDSLLDAVGGLSKRCLFFSVKGESICFQGSRGFDSEPREIPPDMPVQAAPAILEVVLAGIPAETSRTARDLSGAIAAVVGDPSARALLAPLIVGDRVAGVLYVENALDQSAIEAIALVAGVILGRRLDVAEAPRPSSIVRAMAGEAVPPIEETVPLPAPPIAASNPQAERAARVAASRLLLERYSSVKAGRKAGNVLTPLKDDIERLRGAFPHPRHFLDAELLRTLAQGQPELMGR